VRNHAAELVSGFTGQRLLVVGDPMLDCYVAGRVTRINPEAPVPILQALEERQATGGAGNTAKNAAALGAVTTLVGVVGDDEDGRAIEQLAASERYQAILVRDPTRQTTTKTRFLAGAQQMLRVDRESTQAIAGAVEEQVIAAIAAGAAEAHAIIVSDFAKGTITAGVAAAIMAASRRHGIPVMADVKPGVIAHFRGVGCISPNRKEAHEFLGLNPLAPGGPDRAALAERLHREFATDVFLTLSEDGIYVHSRACPGAHVPQEHRIEVADTSGCGDTTAVAIILARLAGATDLEAAQLGNAAGAAIASRIGAVALTPEELLASVRNETSR
jgi:D-beta-D-heptose 7-phosphate kinase/D-beta-D-heptose 1-phosphate adenosyltransferase